MITAPASGLVERSPLSFPLMFLGFGFALGEGGLGVIEMGLHDPLLEVAATLTLSLVLFLDATKLQLDELGKRWLAPALVLGPGTGLIIALGAVALALLLDFDWVLAFAREAILASTDPVVLREIVRDQRIPRSGRQVLKIEAGMNDIVVLPVILVLIAVALGEVADASGWALLLVRLLLLGPAIGFAIGGLGSWAMAKIDAPTPRSAASTRRSTTSGWSSRRTRRPPPPGADGFLGAFAAGLAVVLLNQSLCDCFLEYGDVSSEMAMLLTFVLFGAVLSGIVSTVDVAPTVVLALLVVFAIRPSVLDLVLARANMSWEAHAFVSWFGPRGLNSLLLALLVVQAGVPGSELLLAIVGVVVLASVGLHGASAATVAAWYERRTTSDTLAEERESTAAGMFAHDEAAVRRIAPEELLQLLEGPTPPIVLDVRSRSSYERDEGQAPGSERVLPDQVLEWAADKHIDSLVVAYCT